MKNYDKQQDQMVDTQWYQKLLNKNDDLALSKRKELMVLENKIVRARDALIDYDNKIFDLIVMEKNLSEKLITLRNKFNDAIATVEHEMGDYYRRLDLIKQHFAEKVVEGNRKLANEKAKRYLNKGNYDEKDIVE